MNDFIREVNEVFADYKVRAVCSAYNQINHFNVYELDLQPGCRIRAVENIGGELKLRLKYKANPVFFINDGKMRMIFANEPEKIYLDDLIEKKGAFGPDEIIFGIDYRGNLMTERFTKFPHALICGTTGSGKSVFLHNIIANFTKKNRSIDFYLFDPKYVEFEQYKKHQFDNNVFISVFNTYADTTYQLEQIAKIMEKRFRILSAADVRNIEQYNAKSKDKMRYIIVIIDEFADYINSDKKRGEFETLVCSIAAKSRASGIHLFLASQRSSVEIISGLIKINFQARVCFRMATGVDSRVVIDMNGAENLLNGGDGIFSCNGQITRFQAAYCLTE